MSQIILQAIIDSLCTRPLLATGLTKDGLKANRLIQHSISVWISWLLISQNPQIQKSSQTGVLEI